MKRVKELDGIRGIAIFLVLVWHYIHGQAVVDSAQANYLLKFLVLSWSGVDLFFVLSGFLIVGILLDTRDSSSYFSTFYIRRALRILPLYFVVIILMVILPTYIPNDELFTLAFPLWSFFTFTQNFFMISHDLRPGWLSVSWSLAVEEQFYLLLPLMVSKLTRKRLVYIFLVLICLAPIFRVLFDNLGSYIFPLARADAILLGGLLAVVYRSDRLKSILIENYGYLVGVFFIFLIGTAVLTVSGKYGTGNVFVHLWLAGLYSSFLAVCTLRPGKVIDIFVANRFFIWLGLRSYGIYLFHIPVSALTHQLILGRTVPFFSNWQELSVTLLALLITFVLAEISFRYFESIFLSYGRKFQYEMNNAGA